jgi:hypothetical protein
MERFVELVVAGGLSLLAGLWTARLATTRSPLWVAGVAIALLGALALAAGIWSELDWQPST